MYVAVKGGEQAIARSWDLLAASRRGDPRLLELELAQIREQMRLAVARVMLEGSLYDENLAALALKQAAGDAVEAIFLLRAFRTTLPRLATSLPLDTGAMRVRRRISGTFKDVPGGQILGPTADYTQRLLDFSLAQSGAEADCAEDHDPLPHPLPNVLDTLAREGLIEAETIPVGDPEPPDLTRSPLMFPASRPARLQNLARADEGWLLGLAYATQRGYAESHPFAGEIRMGEVGVSVCPPELGFEIDIGAITLTECQMINQFAGSKTAPPQFTRGYGLSFGEAERKAMAMALVDRSLRAEELGEDQLAPTQQQEFVLYHSDNVEASGFVQHLKLPHYVDFQAELALIRTLRQQAADLSQQETRHD
ncbi:carbon-phosphorus lyase complex subunit PhnI [Paludibacterium purpuratum]|uniref:Alpha-D-ribose 1-methylphosphonate 5-triphosphate synthase subunit PhnI n=1 Tax=Paludibacterium purpuratum TaxID=1144873 RepID=A0A4R7BGW9_9NEIS|nr:carbon-phosphorus lyase complex subunit PhnI [Paludibacterium purpuratum]TDR82976.1 alpha-D-ribose 1-methylphosphonate 5-triphosphate synthase subunit PhnI [Paludibacterium purpuratum]